jgi:hypothetical protein
MCGSNGKVQEKVAVALDHSSNTKLCDASPKLLCTHVSDFLRHLVLSDANFMTDNADTNL